jgi:hypothetical protein
MAYLLAYVFGVAHPLYSYSGSWIYDVAMFLLMATVLAFALNSVGSFKEVLVAGHKYAVIYFVLLYFEAIKMSFLIPIAVLSLILIDIAFHYLIYINTLVIEKIRKGSKSARS